MLPEPTIFVVDDSEAIRNMLRWLLESMRHGVETFASGLEFLSSIHPGRPGCLLLDMRLPEISGLQLLEMLRVRRIRLPVIIITGHGDVETAVRAMKAGVLDYIEKPFNDQVLLDRVQEGLALDARQRQEETQRQATFARLAKLTVRERDVLDRIVVGKPNKVVAGELGISARTVEVHRAHIMEKMRADSLAVLTAMYLQVRHQQTSLSLDP